MQPRRIAHRFCAGAVVGAAAIALVACGGGGDDGTAAPTAATFETVVPTEPLFTRQTDDTSHDNPDDTPEDTATDGSAGAAGSTATGDDSGATSEPAGPAGSAPATTLSTVPDTGVPGLDSTDAFCRAWSQFAGTFQALAGASVLGDPDEAARSEVAASGAVLAAIDDLDANLPAELDPERAALAELAAGMGARAAAARDELLSAGLAQADVDALAQAWLDALAAAGVDDPTVSVDLPPGVDPDAFATAVDAFVAGKPAIVDDPAMINDAEVPSTDQYLVDNCPDQGTLAGNDVVG